MHHMRFCAVSLLAPYFASASICGNANCAFEYLGRDGLPGRRSEAESAILSASMLPTPCETHMKEHCDRFRRLNVVLFELESAFQSGDGDGFAIAKEKVRMELENFVRFVDGEGEGAWPFEAEYLDKIELSITRMLFHEKQRTEELLTADVIDALIPDSILSRHDVSSVLGTARTVKRMLLLAVRIENFKSANLAYPATLDEAHVPLECRMCSKGHELEYEVDTAKRVWMLRCRCDSWTGGLVFDEYVPKFLRIGKKIPLCLSNTFNEKRRRVFNGELLYENDRRLSYFIDHSRGGTTNGVHGIRFLHPSCGNSKIELEHGDASAVIREK